MGLLIEWGIPVHNRMSLCLLVARVALAPSRSIPTCRTYLTCRTCQTYRTYRTYRIYLTCRTCRTYLTYLTCHWNKTTPHWRVRCSIVPAVHPRAVLKTPLRELCATIAGAAIDGMPT